MAVRSGLPVYRAAGSPRLRVGFVFLGFQGVADGSFKARVVVDVALTASLGPPVLSLRIRSLLQPSRTPGFYVDADLSRVCVGGSDDNVHVIASATDGVKFPSPVRAGFQHLSFDDSSLGDR